MSQIISKLAKYDHPGRFNRVAIVSSTAAILYWSYLLLSKRPKKTDAQIMFLDRTKSDKKTKKNKDLNKTFKSLKIILKFILSYEDVALACGISLGLVLRTLLDLWNIQISTLTESAIITANFDQLKYTLLSFAVTMPTLSLVNNMIRFLTDKLRLRLRYNLSGFLYTRYMEKLNFLHLSQDPEFQNVDQLLTVDVDKFCSSLTEVYNNLSKPILDIVLLVHRMTVGYTGAQTPAIMIGWLAIVGSIITQLRRPLAGYIIRETKAEGQLRFVHSRLIQNSEEIAFYGGSEKEKHTIMSSLDVLKQTLDDSITFRFNLGFMDNIVGRYMSTIVGYLAIARPFFSGRYSSASGEERLTQYYIAGRMMMKLAESITRVISAGQDISKLSAYTRRVQTLMDSMDSVDSRAELARLTSSQKRADGGEEETRERPVVATCEKDRPTIEFDKVTLSTPSGDILVKNLTFAIKPRQSVIISGPNGSGKSSLFRVLGGLWPIESGRLVRPQSSDLFYICQKPYMTLGTLRDQIVFPDVKSSKSDEELVEILRVVELKYLLDRDLSLDSVGDWQDVLSGGEKQRVALARLVYHRPKFAILDECTSQVAIDVEQRIYRYLSEELGCTLLSVSHRVKQLAKFHHLSLELDGNGDFEFKRLVAPVE